MSSCIAHRVVSVSGRISLRDPRVLKGWQAGYALHWALPLLSTFRTNYPILSRALVFRGKFCRFCSIKNVIKLKWAPPGGGCSETVKKSGGHWNQGRGGPKVYPQGGVRIAPAVKGSSS